MAKKQSSKKSKILTGKALGKASGGFVPQEIKIETKVSQLSATKITPEKLVKYTGAGNSGSGAGSATSDKKSKGNASTSAGSRTLSDFQRN